MQKLIQRSGAARRGCPHLAARFGDEVIFHHEFETAWCAFPRPFTATFTAFRRSFHAFLARPLTSFPCRCTTFYCLSLLLYDLSLPVYVQTPRAVMLDLPLHLLPHCVYMY